MNLSELSDEALIDELERRLEDIASLEVDVYNRLSDGVAETAGDDSWGPGEAAVMIARDCLNCVKENL